LSIMYKQKNKIESSTHAKVTFSGERIHILTYDGKHTMLNKTQKIY
jgi:hypothetical protein